MEVAKEKIARLEEKHDACASKQDERAELILKTMQELSVKLDKLTESINGNGKPGLKARVLRAETLALVAVLASLGVKGVEQIKPLIAALGAG